ncbi:hypothetical protein EAb13_CDS0067 [Acinetobacter phage EAb13]|nr:hypothetical protein EAb13_CDS0067 [Acinetobacter phage EAb13]
MWAKAKLSINRFSINQGVASHFTENASLNVGLLRQRVNLCRQAARYR